MTRGVQEVSISGEQLQVVMEAESREQGIDGSELDPMTPADIADISGRNMILAIRHDHRQRREAFHYRIAGGGSAEALEQLLKDEPGRVHGLPGCERFPQTAKSGASPGESRRNASDQTLVSTKRLIRASARSCSRTSDPNRASRTARSTGVVPVAQ